MPVWLPPAAAHCKALPLVWCCASHRVPPRPALPTLQDVKRQIDEALAQAKASSHPPSEDLWAHIWKGEAGCGRGAGSANCKGSQARRKGATDGRGTSSAEPELLHACLGRQSRGCSVLPRAVIAVRSPIGCGDARHRQYPQATPAPMRPSRDISWSGDIELTSPRQKAASQFAWQRQERKTQYAPKATLYRSTLQRNALPTLLNCCKVLIGPPPPCTASMCAFHSGHQCGGMRCLL